MPIKVVLLTVLFGASAAAQTMVPLLWTQGQPPETIRQAVREVAEGGNTGFVWESRPHPDYLGPKWWSDLRVAVKESKKFGLEVWIFDEWMYPSGVAGGKIVAQNPRFALHTIEERTITIQGPVSEKEWAIPIPLAPGEELVSVVAFPERFRADSQPAVLPAAITVRWAAPDGRWRICWSVSRPHPPRPGWRMENMIDVMNPAATAEFIRLTHEATYAHFREDFGKTIKGFFSDETGFRNVPSYDSLPGKPGSPLPWSPVFAAYFKKLKGYDIGPSLPALWYDLGPRGRMARFDFVDVCSRALAENFFKPQQEWCRAHGVRLIGHLVEDNHADHNLGYGSGHWFRSTRFLDMPGIDVVGYQVTPGVDSGFVPWRMSSSTPWDMEFFQFGLPAMARGAALLQGTREILSEAFGANGWSEGLRMVKWIGDWHIVNGISVISPHAYTMKYNDPDCPPHFNKMSGTPQWRYYSDWARKFKPLQKLLLDTDPVYDAAVVYTAESAWVGPAQNTAPVVRALETNQISTVVLPYEALPEFGKRFRTIVLPYARFVPAAAIERLAELAEAGTKVIFLEAWPDASVDARGDDAVRAAVKRLKASSSAVLTTIWELPTQPMARRIAVQPAMASLVTSRRKSNDGEWLILHNRSLVASAKGQVSIEEARRHAALFDPDRNAYWSLDHRFAGGKLTVDIDMPPYSLWCIRISDDLPNTERRPVFTQRDSLKAQWKVTRAEGGAPLESSVLQDWRRWAGMEDYAGTVRYSTTLKLAAPAGTAIGLDVGRVEEIAELTVNGKSLGVRLHPPYTWDISQAVRAGDNEISIDVTNTALARWRDSFSHGDAVSGLLGPVTILRSR